MSLATALLTPILGDASPWTPRRLFQLGEAGGVYDPSDLTAEKVAWRRNLLTWSEDFTNAAWTKLNSSITANAGTSWDGTATASKLVEDTANTSHRLARSFTSAVVGTPYTPSIYAKAAERSWIAVRVDNLTNSLAWFNLASGTIGTVQSAVTATMVAAGNGWYRCTVTGTSNVASNSIEVYVTTGDGVSSYTGDGTSGVLIDSAQFEQSPTATAYQRITDFTSDFLAAFPTHGLYQDAAGTTPVTALGQPVGLVIDSKTGGLASIGATVLANGDFASGASWTAGTGWSIAAGVATKTAGTASVLSQAVTLTIPGTYRLIYTMTRSAGTLTPRITGGTTVNATARSASGTYTEYVTTVTGNTTFEFSADASFAGTVDDVTLQLVPGVHAIQATNSSRPLLDGRVNLLERTEQFDDAYWSKTGCVATANTSIAPNGTSTADTLTAIAGSGFHYLRQGSLPTSGSLAVSSYTYTLRIKRGTSRWVFVSFYDSRLNYFDFDTGTFGDNPENATAQSLPNGWWEISQTRINNLGSGGLNIGLASGNNGGNFTAVGTETVLVWGADFRLATDAAYPYQRVAAATDYADVGVPRSFAFDGFDDSLYTASNMDLSGTDKVTVLAGVRKLSDAARGIVAELSATTASNNGSFRLAAPEDATFEYSMTSRGTADISAVIDSAVYAAPNTSVITGIGNISGDVVQLRINAAVIATNTTDQGTGNYGSYVLFIGRRNNASLPFSGKAYQLIVRGALTDAATLAQAERYVGAKTGIFL